MKSKKILAWHFLPDNGKLARNHGAQGRKEIKTGMVLKVNPPLYICNHGLHGSISLLDALHYAPGSILCRTEHSGVVKQYPDKLCSSVRKVIWMGDVSNLLHRFACTIALEILRKNNVDNKLLYHAVKVKRQWIKNKTRINYDLYLETCQRVSDSKHSNWPFKANNNMYNLVLKALLERPTEAVENTVDKIVDMYYDDNIDTEQKLFEKYNKRLENLVFKFMGKK